MTHVRSIRNDPTINDTRFCKNTIQRAHNRKYNLSLVNEADQITAKSRPTHSSKQLPMTSIELNSLLPVKQPWHRQAGSSGAGIQFRLHKLSRECSSHINNHEMCWFHSLTVLWNRLLSWPCGHVCSTAVRANTETLLTWAAMTAMKLQGIECTVETCPD